MPLTEIEQAIAGCTRCVLHKGRTNIVLGAGDPTTNLMLIGEGPGANEDLQGEPFVGAAGHLLNRLLERVEIARENVYITNVVKCRPPNNRNPEADEVHACLPFLKRQVHAINPRVIVTLGKYATWYVTGVYGSMGALLDSEDLVCGFGAETIPVIPLYHPSYLLRQGKGDRARDLLREAIRRLGRAKKLAR